MQYRKIIVATQEGTINYYLSENDARVILNLAKDSPIPWGALRNYFQKKHNALMVGEECRNYDFVVGGS